jgi:hypothetical protein
MEGMGWQKLHKFIGGGWYGHPYLAAMREGQRECRGTPQISSRLVSCPRGSFSENCIEGGSRSYSLLARECMCSNPNLHSQTTVGS